MRTDPGGADWSPVTGGLPVTCSIGVTTVTGPAVIPATALAAADRNLYTAKRAGRDRVRGDGVTASA